jgi:predicted transglutaminase-like cysteine proteinase
VGRVFSRIRSLALALLLVAAIWPGAAVVAAEAFAWQALVEQTRGDSDRHTAELINRRINRLKHISDMANWQRNDYWATPGEFYARGAGDCEDFAIAKFFLMNRQGVSTARLRLMVARLFNPANRKIEPHLVLLYLSPDEREPGVMDNLRDDILPLSARHDLLPVASFDTKDLWTYAAGSWKPAGPASNLGHWSALLERWTRQQAEGQVAAGGQP